MAAGGLDEGVFDRESWAKRMVRILAVGLVTYETFKVIYWLSCPWLLTDPTLRDLPKVVCLLRQHALFVQITMLTKTWLLHAIANAGTLKDRCDSLVWDKGAPEVHGNVQYQGTLVFKERNSVPHCMNFSFILSSYPPAYRGVFVVCHTSRRFT